MAVALVTGSAKGIGRALVLALAGAGYDVAVHYHTSADAAQAVAGAVSAQGREALVLQADVTHAHQARQLVLDTQAHFGQLDVLINNVGNFFPGDLADTTADIWHEMFASNLHATFYTCQTALPLLKKTRGRIINITYAGSEHLVARPRATAYTIAKTGVLAYTKALAKTALASGVTANVISPGVMENDSSNMNPNNLPMGRHGKLSELTDTALFLLSDAAAYITGVHIEVAGGWNL